MRGLCPLLIALVLAGPAAAQESDDLSEGLDLLGQGTRLLMEGLLKQLGPALDELHRGLADLDAYELPEILPNGDIIIRRKRPLPMEIPEDGIDL